MKKGKLIKYSSVLEIMAKHLGEKRFKDSKYLEGVNPDYELGEDNLQAQINGMLGELIALEQIELRGHEYQQYIFTNGSSPKEDFIINGKKVDVKTAPKHGKYCLITEITYRKKKVDYYWIFHLLGDYLAQEYIATYEEVELWEFKQMKYTKPRAGLLY